MAWAVGDIPPQHGRVAVVTGANGGLGLASARALAGAGAHVVMAARNRDRAEVARQDILGDHPTASLEIAVLDLASLASVESCAAAIIGSYERIDLLVNNGGLMATPEDTTQDGFELQLGTNHLGHFVLTSRLLSRLVRAPGSRIVTVTSLAYLTGRTVDPANPHLRRGRYDPWVAYAQSKLANLQFAVELDRQLAAAGAQVSSLAAHPGLANTGLQAASVSASGGWSQRAWHVLARYTGMSPARAALPQLRAATDPAARGGEMYAPRMVTRGPPVLRRPLRRYTDPDRARILWEVSERETGVGFDVTAKVAGEPR